MRRLTALLALLPLAVFLASCGSPAVTPTPTAPPASATPTVLVATAAPTSTPAPRNTPTSAPVQPPGDERVDLDIVGFVLPSLAVPVGAEVTWTNQDGAPHTATANDGEWDSGTLLRGQAYTRAFQEPGRFAYFCVIHPDMVGEITVE